VGDVNSQLHLLVRGPLGAEGAPASPTQNTVILEPHFNIPAIKGFSGVRGSWLILWLTSTEGGPGPEPGRGASGIGA